MGMPKGAKFTDEHKKKIAAAHMGLRPNATTRRKISEGRRGSKNPNWKGGKSSCFAPYRKQRYDREKQAPGFFTLAEWETLKAQFDWACPCCKRREPEIKLTVDHIIPLSRGGSHNIENIQPLCKQCNCRKHAKIIRYDL